ncbi:MAG: hypothetical protein K9K93_04205 [Acholeplasmataceae bacterium]|nr:hypothetical protein [Acholeplasmataceae bacterium]
MIRALIDFVRLNHHRKHFNHKQIETYQLKALERLVRLAKDKSPYYKETLKDTTFQSLDDFHKLPSINKTIMMNHFSTINTCGLNKEDCMADALRREQEKDYLGYYQKKFVIGLSSGTSGNKGLYITPKALTKRLPAVFLARGGVGLRDLPLRILFMLRVFSQGFEDINQPGVKLTYLSTMTNPREVILTMNEERTNVLMAPPSMIRFLLPLAKDLIMPLKRVITYAEVLTKEDKAQFKSVFKTDVVEIYQASEGQIASPCRHGHLHINEDLVYVELYDHDNQLIQTPHMIGTRMVITNLVNTAQPLIRYEMNDLIVLDDPCPCGSSFRRIEKILGRHDDVIYALDSKDVLRPVFPDLFARWIITESDDIREFQVVQQDLSTINVKIDAPKTFDPSRLKKRIEHALMEYDQHANIVVQVGPLELPKDKNKYKRFIRQIDHPDVHSHRTPHTP